MIKIISLLVLLLSFIKVASAQNIDRIETKEVFLNITGTFKSHDTIIVFFGGAKNIGLENRQLVKAYQSSRSAVPGISEARELREVASGKILFIDTLIIALVTCYDPKDSLENGDLVSVKLNTPALSYRSIFSELAFKDILLANINRDQLYFLQTVIANDSKRVEDSIYDAIVNDFHYTYKNVNWSKLPKTLLEEITTGRFKGKKPFEIIGKATRKDIEPFLLYCSVYPGGYMGKKLRASESFAGWMTSSSPYSFPEVKNALFPVYKNKIEFARLLPQYKHDIISEGSAASLALKAVELSGDLKYKEAHELADFSIALVEAVKDTASNPAVLLSNAQIYQNEEKYAESIILCDKAIKASIEAGNKDLELQAISKKIFCLYKSSKFTTASIVIAEAEKKLAQYQPLMPKNLYDQNEQKIYEQKSFAYYEAGEYIKTLATLDTLILINKRINSYDAKIKNADLYKFIGRVNNDKGKPRDALDAFLKSADLYKNNSDAANRAIVENDIAYSHYLLGEYRTAMEFTDSALTRLLKSGDYNNAGYSRTLKGSCYWELGNYDSAVLLHKEAIALRKKSNNLSGQAFSWKKIGELYLLSGLKIQALNAFDSAANLYATLKDSSGLTGIYNKKGEVYLNDDSYKKAANFFEKAKGVSNKTTVEALYNLGNAWEAIDTIKARKYYEASRDSSKKAGNTNYQFYATKALAYLAYGSHNSAKGQLLYDECLQLGKEINTAEATASCLSLKAYRFKTETELDSALLYYQKAITIFDTVDKSQSIWRLNDVSQVYLSMGEFAKADKALTTAITLARETSNSIALGNTLQSSTFLYSLTAEFTKGMIDNDSAIAIFKRSGNIVRLAHTYGSRATLLKYMGEYRQSITANLFADSVYKDELLTENRGVILNNIGETYLVQSDYANALRYIKQSLELLQKGVVDESYLLVQANIAECLYELKKTSEAKTLFLEILPKAQRLNLNRIASGMAMILGKIYEAENKLQEASSYFSYAKEYAAASGEKDKMIEASMYLGKINATEGKQDSAEKNLRYAAELVNKYKTGNGWSAYYELGLLLYNQQKFDSSIIYFKQAVELLDKNAENLYGGEEAKKMFNNDPRKSDLYNKITFSYYNIGNIKEAWAYANRSNIAGIKELSGSLSATSSDVEKNEALKKLLAMQQSKKALENTLEKQNGVAKEETLKKIEILEAEYNNFLQDMVERYPELSTYFTRSNADEFNNYKSQLPKDVAVLLYLLNNKTLMIFSLTNEKLAVDTMTIDISPKVNSFIASIKNTEKQTGTGPLSERSEPVDEVKTISAVEFKDVSSELYKILIASIADKIKDKKKLCIIPTGVFSNMPFQCLGKNMPGNNFRFLIEDHSIFYTSKMSIFNRDKRDSSANKNLSSFAAFGVPDASLHYNISEVKEIGKILGSDSTVYTDARATESMAKQSLRQKKYIHFATHGVLNYSSDYSQSYIKLLPDKDTSGGNNGQLTMREIQRLGITDCNMVILSACQTAVSKQLVNGWNISPANSFLVSNVKTVVASLWKVADEPTGLLMEYFYENLSQPKSMEKAEALRQAQIRLSQDARFRHPNYWGAFVLYGDWQ